MGWGARVLRARLPDAARLRPGAPRRVQGRRVRRRRDPAGGRPDRAVRVLSGALHSVLRGARQRRRLRALRCSPTKLAEPVDLGPRLRVRRRAAAAWRGTPSPQATLVGRAHHAARPGVRAGRAAHAAADEAAAARAVDPADHHAALRHRPGADPAVRPRRHGDDVARRRVRHPAQPLDLRHARASPSRRCSRSRRSPFMVLLGVLQGVAPSLEEASQTLRASPLAHLPHRHLAADPPGPRQRVPDRLHREHGGFRQPAGDRRQLQRAVDRHLLRRGRRLARPGPRRGAGDRAAGIHPRPRSWRSASGSAGAATPRWPARATPAFRPRCRPALRVALLRRRSCRGCC